MKKVTYVCAEGQDHFVKPIFRHTGGNLLIIYAGMSIDEFGNKLKEFASESDVIWLEWANETSIYTLDVLYDMFKDKKVIVRLHSYEALNPPLLDAMKWERVDDVIFVARHVKEIAIKHNPNIAGVKGLHVVHNGVPFADQNLAFAKIRKDNNKKGPNKKIGFLGHINHKKGPDLLMQVFLYFHAVVPEIEFYVAGEFQENRYYYYMNHIMNCTPTLLSTVRYEGKVEYKDVLTWLHQKVDFLLCTSPWEGHPVGLSEAMSVGVMPLVHNFKGADELFPRECVWTTLPDLVRLVMRNQTYRPMFYYEYCLNRYNQKDMFEKLTAIIEG